MKYKIIGHNYYMHFYDYGFSPSVEKQHVGNVLHTQAIIIDGQPVLHFFTDYDDYDSQILFLVDEEGQELCPLFHSGYDNTFIQLENKFSDTYSNQSSCIQHSFEFTMRYTEANNDPICDIDEIHRVAKLGKKEFIELFNKEFYQGKKADRLTAITAWRIFHAIYKKYEKKSPHKSPRSHK